MPRLVAIVSGVLLLLACPARADEPLRLDARLPAYTSVSGVRGNLNAVGSDTLNNLITIWAEDFRARYPEVVIGIEGKGSSTAPPALIQGTAQLGPMSRAMTIVEIDAFEAAHGYAPTPVPVGIDALALFVHKDNPLRALTLRQVDAIFSQTFRRGSPRLERWGDVGLPGAWTRRHFSAFGRNSASGTYGFFKEVVLRGGDFRATVKEKPGSSAVIQGISRDLFGIGYTGIGHSTAGVKPLALARDENTPAYAPTYENTLSGKYPLARFLIIYVNKLPDQPLDRLTFEFLRFALSAEGQRDVIGEGYFPVPATLAEEVLDSLRR